ncbi:MAG: hydrolase, partial [Salinibacter sp.]
GALEQSLYHPDDPFCEERAPDDDTYTLDHFYAKLLRLPDTMQTEAGRTEAEQRAAFLRTYLDQLEDELNADGPLN